MAYDVELILRPHTERETAVHGVFGTMRQAAEWIYGRRPYGANLTDCYINNKRYRVKEGELWYDTWPETPVTWWRVGSELMTFDEYSAWREKNYGHDITTNRVAVSCGMSAQIINFSRGEIK